MGSRSSTNLLVPSVWSGGRYTIVVPRGHRVEGDTMELEGYARSETGPVREHNEDAWKIDLEQGVFVVADGMGGHAAGEVASSMAVETVHQTLVGARDPDETRLVRDHESEDPADILRERLRYATQRLFEGTAALGGAALLVVLQGVIIGW